ncbi:MAG: Ig-like domain-containing protein [Clostridium sp.]|nr:Ig-like domain-containing protein [Clostridium sp.]
MRKQFLQGLKRTASVGLTAVMLLSSGGTFLASGIGLTQVAAEETVIDSTEDTEHMESVDGTEDTERTGEALEAETGELPADGDIYPEPAATDLVSSFITDAALLADVQAILGKGSSATYQDMQNYSGAVNLDSFSNVQEIKNIEGIGGFYNATSFSFGKATQVTVIPNYTFANMTKLTSVTLPDSISEIGVQAFQKCTGLSEIVLPAKLVTIGDNAFESSGIQRIDFSKCTSLTTIGKRSFENCGVQNIDISNGISEMTIDEAAFRGCTALQSVFLPDGLTKVEPFAFANCKSMTSLSIPETCVLDWKTFSAEGSPGQDNVVKNLNLQIRPKDKDVVIPLNKEVALPLYVGKSLEIDWHDRIDPDENKFEITGVTISDSAVSKTENTKISYKEEESEKQITGVNLTGTKVIQDVTVTVKTSMTFYTFRHDGKVETMTITPSITYKVSVQGLPCTDIEVESDYYISKTAGASTSVSERYIMITPVFKSDTETMTTDAISWEYGNSVATVTVADDKSNAKIEVPKSGAVYEEIPITIKAGSQKKVVTVHVVTTIKYKSIVYNPSELSIPLVSGGSAGSITVKPSAMLYNDSNATIKDRLCFESDNDKVVKVVDNRDNSCTITALAVGTATITATSIAMKNATMYVPKATFTVTVTDSGTHVELRDTGTGTATGNPITFDATKGQTTQTYSYVFLNSSGTATTLSSNDLEVTVANSAVATVTPNTSAKTIAIKSLKYGTTTVTIAPKGKSENAVSYTISVPSNIKTINSVDSITGNVGTTQTVFKSAVNSFGVKSTDATPAKIKAISGNTVKFTSTNANVASIDANGTVSLKAKGSATVKMSVYASASATTPLLEKSVNVTVKQPVTGITITSANGSKTVDTGDTLQLTAKVSPSNASDTSVTWSSSSTGIAKVSTAGLVTGVATGTAVITAKANDGSNKSATFTVTVTKKVTSITLNKTTLNIKTGATEQLTAKVQPTDATNSKVTWSSNKPTVAEVDQTGMITAKQEGSAVITVKAQDGSGKTANCQVTVNPSVVLVNKITINPSSKSLAIGKTVTLSPTVAPSNATDKGVTWKSSNSKVAKVDEKSGVVTAVAAGTATITCTAADGSRKSATCKITVTNPAVKVTKLRMNKTSVDLLKGKTVQLKVTVTPSNATNKAVTWTSSNKRIATVTSNGLVKAVRTGTVTITAKAKDGSGKKVTCKINVYADSVESYVARIYTKALGRDPEPAGLKYWVGEIKAGRKTAVQVAEMFFFAPEFTNKKLNNKEYVKVLYRTFMGREADQGGLNYWIDRLNKGESRKSVLKAFAGCPEFKAIVKSFGL